MIDWQAIDTVLLDMDGTLLDLHFDNYFWLTHLPQRYAEAHGIPLNEATTELYAHIKAYEGTLQWYCLDHWSTLINMDIPKLKMEVQHKIQLRPHSETFLQRLRQAGKKVVLITNAHPAGLKIKLKVTQIDRWLDIVISSHQFQKPKEEQAFWQQLQAQEQFDPERTVFFDDTPRILRSAKTFGIKHLVCITQPDMQMPPRLSGEFIDISHFDEVMPDEVDV
jgi:HAD superfamily hydrolase (TIGR01509 family)